jgi:uncharacterized protein (TIGR02266 family)
MLDERRTTRRHRTPGLRVTYWRPGADHVDADAFDLGRGGLFLCTDAPLPPGAHIAVQIQVVTEETPWSVFGRVVWTRAQGDGEAMPPGMGVQFLDVDDSRLEQLLGIAEPEGPRSGAAPVLDLSPGKQTIFGVGLVPPAVRDGLASVDDGWDVAAERAEGDAPVPSTPIPIVAASPPRKKTIFGVGEAPESSRPSFAHPVPTLVVERTPLDRPVRATRPAAESAPASSRRTPASSRANGLRWLILSASIAVGAAITFLLTR